MGKITAVSYEGDKLEISALSQLAREKGVTMGNLVAVAVREKYGRELEPITSFLRKRDLKKSRTASSDVTDSDHA